MAKTFDNISEASATNYLFLFSQRTLALQNEPPTPPPLNALGLPCKGVYLLWKRVQNQKQKQKHPIEPKVSLCAKVFSLQKRAIVPEASQPAAADATVGKTAGQGEDKEKTFAQKIAPLAKKITEYINDHQDDAAQEDRWRTTMKREIMKRFREQREAIDKLETAMLTRIDEKMDQLMKSITR